MRQTDRLMATWAIALIITMVGCEQPANISGSAQKTGLSAQAHEHGATAEANKASSHSDHGHAHGAGPHQGTLADWGGGKYHVEFTVDHTTQEATIFILGGDAKTATPIKAAEGKILLTIKKPAFQLELAAQPLAGESTEACSRFAGKHEKLGIIQEFSGTISGEIEGTPYAADFSEEAHEHAHP